KIIINEKELFFLSRHGKDHKISPTNINYRANICALKMLGVTDIISISAVGSLKEDLFPKTFVIVDQYIDLTNQRKKTFFDNNIVAHVSMAHPTSKGLMNACENALKATGTPYQKGGTYVVMEGPQFSSKAESQMYRSWNADVIGMTNMPEAKLAREAEIRYASIAMVTDFDCWHDEYDNVSVKQVIDTFKSNTVNAKNVIKNVVKKFEDFCDPNDPALTSLDAAIITNHDCFNTKDLEKLKHISTRFFSK
ncbi:MAG: 5'-methylthioadenosine phosphorylase, partial [Verrucomicrobiota bacterium]|nr:5'-methylthioadenosine phosphorylase [Verrucomicrobiota bacterium]